MRGSKRSRNASQWNEEYQRSRAEKAAALLAEQEIRKAEREGKHGFRRAALITTVETIAARCRVTPEQLWARREPPTRTQVAWSTMDVWIDWLHATAPVSGQQAKAGVARYIVRSRTPRRSAWSMNG